MRIGVLSLQGGVVEHINAIKSLEHDALEVKTTDDLHKIDGLIIPGGESTTIGTLLKVTGLLEPLRTRIKNGLPTWGTCAGMILLAKKISGEENSHLGLLNVSVKRNAYGRQKDSFVDTISMPLISNESINCVFIRAPYVEEVFEGVEILGEYKDNIIAVKQNNILATSFHPELTDDLNMLKYFLSIIN